jgi:hypothetical protein
MTIKWTTAASAVAMALVCPTLAQAQSVGGGTATSAGSLAVGTGAVAGPGNANTSVGDYAKSTGTNSTAVGYGATSTGDYSAAFGLNSTATGTASSALGPYSAATRDNATATGYAARASGASATATGSYATGSGIMLRHLAKVRRLRAYRRRHWEILQRPLVITRQRRGKRRSRLGLPARRPGWVPMPAVSTQPQPAKMLTPQEVMRWQAVRVRSPREFSPRRTGVTRSHRATIRR